MNTKQAIEKVLTDNGVNKSMKVPAIIEAGLKLATSLKGATPGQTFYSTLYAENKKDDGLVTQVARGEFKLNPKRRPLDAPRTRTSSAKTKAAPARKTGAAKKTTARKTAAKKTTARKTTARKSTAARKSSARKK